MSATRKRAAQNPAGSSVNVGRVLWSYCHILRHDGIDYGEYLDQITYLLFLKMSESERQSVLSSAWAALRDSGDDDLLAAYEDLLRRLGEQSGAVGSVFADARSAFSNGSSLARLVALIDQLGWNDLDIDIQATAFEYLLDQAAAEGKKGAGQYFTPRPLVRAIAECVRPGELADDRSISDPAAGTAGFLIVALELMKERGLDPVSLDIHATELVERPRRLAVMNLLLHGAPHAVVRRADSLLSPPIPDQFSVTMTNPPFGVKGGQMLSRPDFWVRTTNKQVNFVQHVVTELAPGGRAAIVLPDSCLFGEVSRLLWATLIEICDVHTIWRLPDGTFAPYTAGTLTNVVFLTKGRPTSKIWTYDARSSRSGGKRPMRPDELGEMVAAFGSDPYGRRDDSPSETTPRWKFSTVGDLAAVSFEVDRLAWRASSVVLPARDDILVTLDSLIDELRTASEGAQKLRRHLE